MTPQQPIRSSGCQVLIPASQLNFSEEKMRMALRDTDSHPSTKPFLDVRERASCFLAGNSREEKEKEEWQNRH